MLYNGAGPVAIGVGLIGARTSCLMNLENFLEHGVGVERATNFEVGVRGPAVSAVPSL